MIILSLSGSNSVVSDLDSFYFIGPDGLEFVDKRTSKSYGYVSFSGGFISAFAQDISFVYLGTSAGLYAVEKPVDRYFDQDLSSRVHKETRSSWLDSENIYSIHGIDRNYLVLGTDAGIEIIHRDYWHLKSITYNPVKAVHRTVKGDIFYGGAFGLAVKQAPITVDWVDPDRILTFPFLPDSNVNDIDSITENNDTTVGIATNDGIMLIQQRVPLTVSPTAKFFTEYNHG